VIAVPLSKRISGILQRLATGKALSALMQTGRYLCDSVQRCSGFDQFAQFYPVDRVAGVIKQELYPSGGGGASSAHIAD